MVVKFVLEALRFGTKDLGGLTAVLKGTEVRLQIEVKVRDPVVLIHLVVYIGPQGHLE